MLLAAGIVALVSGTRDPVSRPIATQGGVDGRAHPAHDIAVEHGDDTAQCFELDQGDVVQVDDAWLR
jgi:hypothetical protein